MSNHDEGVFRYEELEVNLIEQTAYYRGEEVCFTNREFQVLAFLMKYCGQVFSKKQIYEQITEDNEREDYHTVEITLSRIRKKLEQCSGRKDFIVTIRGRGYKFRK